MRSTVWSSWLSPSSAKNSPCSGTRIALAAISALTVSSPSDGGQSIRQTSQRPGAALSSAASSRWVLRSKSMSSISAPDRSTVARNDIEPRHRRRDDALARASRCRSAAHSSTASRSAWPMPSPVEALPCGSRSISSTLQPGRGQRGGEVDRGGRLAHPAFLIRDRDPDHCLLLPGRRRTPVATMIWASASVRLGSKRKSPCHAPPPLPVPTWRRGPSAAARASFLWKICARARASAASGAKARALITANGRVGMRSMRRVNDLRLDLEHRSGAAQEIDAQPPRFDQRRPALRASAATTRPGKPAPVPRSSQGPRSARRSASSWALSTTWRDQNWSSVDGRNEILACRSPRATSAPKASQPRECFT